MQKILTIFIAMSLNEAGSFASPPVLDALSELRMIESQTELRQARILEAEFTKAKHSTRGKIGLVLADLFLERSPRLSAVYLNAAQNRITEKSWAARAKFVGATVAYHRGRYQQALSELSGTTIEDLNPSLRDGAQQLRLESLFELQQYRQLISEYDRYFRKFRTARIDEGLRKKLAMSYFRLGWWAKFRDVTEELAINYPLTTTSVWAFNRLIEQSCPVPSKGIHLPLRSDFLAKLSLNNAMPSGKQEAILALLETPLENAKGFVAIPHGLERLEILVRARLYEVALPLARELLQVTGFHRREREKLLMLSAKVFEVTGNYEDAMLGYGAYFREYGTKRRVIDVATNVGQIMANQGHHAAAASMFAGLSHRSRRRSIKWLYFWSAYRAGQYQLALSLLERSGYLRPLDGQFNGALLYWKARIHEKLDQTNESETAFRELLAKYPSSYYSNVALARDPGLREEAISKGLVASLSSNIFIDEDGEVSFDEDLPFVAKDRDQMLVATLVDDFVSGRRNFYDSDFMPTRDESVFWVAGTANAVAQLKPVVKDKTLLNDYPLPFYDYIANFSQLANLDILMVYSLMRAESRFDPDAASHVGAMGLMQIMPYTGSKIADLVADDAFRAEQLKTPVTNIAYGTYYLGLLRSMFGDNPYLAAAAYNAGPDAVVKWLTRCKDCEFDEVVESISYRETRRYVKKIIEYAGYYSRIYRGEHPLDTLPSLPTDLPQKGELF